MERLIEAIVLFGSAGFITDTVARCLLHRAAYHTVIVSQVTAEMLADANADRGGSKRSILRSRRRLSFDSRSRSAAGPALRHGSSAAAIPGYGDSVIVQGSPRARISEPAPPPDMEFVADIVDAPARASLARAGGGASQSRRGSSSYAADSGSTGGGGTLAQSILRQQQQPPRASLSRERPFPGALEP